MARTEYEFEELPLVQINGYWAGLVDGVATLDYDLEGHWEILRIRVEVQRKGLKSYMADPIEAVRALIINVLLNDPKWRGHVKDHIEEELEHVRHPVREQERGWDEI